MAPFTRTVSVLFFLLLTVAFVSPQNNQIQRPNPAPRENLLLIQGESSGIKGDMAFRITEVKPGSPASRAGLQINDLILSIDDLAVHSQDQLDKTILQPALRPGTKYSISLARFNPATGRFEVTRKKLNAE
jgi:S1-C subfamily serine protease